MNEMLAVTVTCKDNPECLFEGKDVFITITITNKHSARVGFPLEFVKDRGPIIRLIDTETGSDTNLPTHPADGALLEEFTMIEPGGSIEMAWVIKPSEMEQFGHKYVDVAAEVTIMADIVSEGKKSDFRGSHTIRIVSKDKPKPEIKI